MTTPFSTIFDSFMANVTDYKLIDLYTASVTDFETYLSTWLYSAVADFKSCNQSLAYSSSTFTQTLTQENIDILVLLMKKYWVQKSLDDIKQMNLAITDRDFRRYAESQNMKAKQDRLIQLREEISQKLVDYGLDNVDWANWFNGVFYVPS